MGSGAVVNCFLFQYNRFVFDEKIDGLVFQHLFQEYIQRHILYINRHIA